MMDNAYGLKERDTRYGCQSQLLNSYVNGFYKDKLKDLAKTDLIGLLAYI